MAKSSLFTVSMRKLGVSLTMASLATAGACNENVYLFSSCPPSRRFEAMGNQSLLGAFATSGLPREWLCGRNSGLRLRDGPHLMVSNVSTNLGDDFSLSIWFLPGNTTVRSLQTILSITGFSDDDNDLDGCRGNLLQIGQYGNRVLLRYRDAFSICRVLLLRKATLIEASLVKLILTLNKTDTLTFLDGNLISQSSGLDLSNAIDRDPPCQVQLFGSNDYDIDHFRGSLYRFSILDESLSTEQVINNSETLFGGICDLPIFNLSGVVEPDVLVIPQGANVPHKLSIPTPGVDSVEIQVLSLPKAGYLQLEGKEIDVGSNLGTLANLDYYMADGLFFNNPRINTHGVERNVHDESFTYRLQSYDDDGFMVAQSQVMKFSVIVQMVNHPPYLEAPDQASSSGNSWIIPGIKLEDSVDHDMNLVRVDIFSRRGRVTVATEDGRTILRKYECSGRSASPWQCVGDGYQDRRLIFVAAPSDVTKILHNLEYQTLTVGRPEADNVTIVVYDGESGDCLTLDEHWAYQKGFGNRYPSLHPDGCVSAQAIIHIPGYTVEPTGDYGGGDHHATGSVLPDLLFWVVFIATLMCVCWSRLKKCAQRGSPVEADSDEDFEMRTTGVCTDNDGLASGASVTSSVYWDEVSLS